ncbi:NUDIX hydrolase [Gluconobacter morbifer]|uniref:NUDIX Hydrolase n=1 Tax=Gluconobacter morbifer G707 TaxID=1088869 RepID=G6XGF1_9PROT|nr:NUDIX domain-containing protein [Gluconobacter morbifer]EHH69259.1 NUDIX Hydrolase [Gluconobacter morbifer G707]
MQTEPRIGCGAAILVDGRLLLIRRKRDPEAGCWGLPGGKVDLFEPVRAAVEREVMEETGLRVSASDLLCVIDQIDRDAGTHWIAPVWLVVRPEGTARLMEPEKHGAFGWFALDALPGPLTAAAVQAISALRARGSGKTAST